MFSIISKCRPLTQFSDVSRTLIALSSQSAAVQKEKPLKEKDALKKQILGCRHVYPEFLPDPKVEFRNLIREKLERSDMVARRTQIDIGEFYVGKSVHNFKASATAAKKHVTGCNCSILHAFPCRLGVCLVFMGLAHGSI